MSTLFVPLVRGSPVRRAPVAHQRLHAPVIVTRSMQQAVRVADTTAFFPVDIPGGGRAGILCDLAPTKQFLDNPREIMIWRSVSAEFGGGTP